MPPPRSPAPSRGPGTRSSVGTRSRATKYAVFVRRALTCDEARAIARRGTEDREPRHVQAVPARRRLELPLVVARIRLERHCRAVREAGEPGARELVAGVRQPRLRLLDPPPPSLSAARSFEALSFVTRGRGGTGRRGGFRSRWASALGGSSPPARTAWGSQHGGTQLVPPRAPSFSRCDRWNACGAPAGQSPAPPASRSAATNANRPAGSPVRASRRGPTSTSSGLSSRGRESPRSRASCRRPGRAGTR